MRASPLIIAGFATLLVGLLLAINSPLVFAAAGTEDRPAGVDLKLGKLVTPAALGQAVTVLNSEYAARD
jgi:hypothetical protein